MALAGGELHDARGKGENTNVAIILVLLLLRNGWQQPLLMFSKASSVLGPYEQRK